MRPAFDLGLLAQRGALPLIVAGLAGVAIIAAANPSVPLPRAAILSPIAYSMTVLADFAAATILIATWRASSPRRATVALALSFAANALLLLIAMVALPILPTLPPVLQVPRSFGVWIYVAWHVLAGLGALAYVAFRNDDDRVKPSLSFISIALATAVLLVGAAIVVPIYFGARLPRIAQGDPVAGLAASGIGAFAVYILVLAGVLVSRLRDPGPIERGLAFSLLALAAEMAILLLDGTLFTSIFYAGRLLILAGALFVFVAAMRTLISARMRLGAIEKTYDEVVDKSERRAARITSVWQIALQTESPEIESARNVLTIAAQGLRPGRPMMGFLSALDQGRIVVEEIVFTGFTDERRFDLERLVARGTSYALRDTIASLLLDRDRAQSWDDVRSLLHDGSAAATLGVRSFVGASMMIGGRARFVYFSSPESMLDEPFAEDDRAYVDVVASFFASRFENEQQFQKIKFEIEHDSLTGLENQVQFRAAVRDYIRDGKSFALAFVDIDGFRHINGKDGFGIGDAILVEVANSLASLDRENRVTRMNGDLFAVLLRGVESASVAARSVAGYAELFETPFRVGAVEETRGLRVGASIGVALHPGDGDSVEDLARRADVALKVAKNLGGSKTVLFEQAMDSIVEDTRLRFIELADAIADDQLVLAYQPTFELATRRIVGAEALVRWDHPERGRLPPSEFIEFAERNNLIGALTVWVFQQVARDILSRSAWPPGFRIYFNVAAQMLDDVAFIAMLDQTLRANPALAPHLGIEVTESAAMQNVERSMSTIGLFRSLGVSVAIDDFGTGHSSLSYLKNLTVDVIKIDRSFVSGLSIDERDNAIVQMMLGVTDRFGFASLAEGIETEEQLAWLLERGCRFGQGYLIARPAPFDALLDRLRASGAADYVAVA